MPRKKNNTKKMTELKKSKKQQQVFDQHQDDFYNGELTDDAFLQLSFDKQQEYQRIWMTKKYPNTQWKCYHCVDQLMFGSITGYMSDEGIDDIYQQQMSKKYKKAFHDNYFDQKTV